MAARMELADMSFPPFFLADVSPVNPGYGFSPAASSAEQQSVLGVSEYMAFDEGRFDVDSSPTITGETEKPVVAADCGPNGSSAEMVMDCEDEMKRMRSSVGCRIGFRTKSEVDILDDGFKWRKYGKKSVKNSPNPRNYYRCSYEGCGVKKRVERDREDPRYVITTYEGVHNHMSPGTVCYDYSPHSSPWVSCEQVPLMAPNAWRVQTANSFY